jgi:23S rRNA (cytosine1962-C5)-methyltransferase
VGLDDYLNRVRKNARHWGRWARRRGIQCYRVYDRDIPEYAFALDVYADRAHLQEYAAGSASVPAGSSVDEEKMLDPIGEDRLHAVHAATAQALGFAAERVVLKRRARRRAGEQHDKTGLAGEEFIVEEGGCRFLVNLEAYLDTGLFLDHRNTRALVAAEAGGKRLLNLFCYTGSFTVHAARGGAVQSIGVDLSNTYLDWAARNFALNGLDLRRHRLERADARRWLEAATGERFDLIVLDPPSFSQSKAMRGVLDIQRDHAELLSGCARLLAPGGVVYFSTNLRGFKFDRAAAGDLEGEEISQRTVPEDFRDRRVHRCWRFVRSATRRVSS